MSQPFPLLRSSVQTWECDQMGHMNVQFYVAKANEALAALSSQLGHGPSTMRADGTALIPVSHHIRFHREQRPGAPLTMAGGVVDRAGDVLDIYEEMTNTASGVVAATINAQVRLMDRSTRAPLPLTDELEAAADAHRITRPEHGMPRGLELTPPVPEPDLARADAKGMVYTWQGQVKAEMCDSFGFMTQQHFMGIVSDSIPNLLSQTRGDDRSANSKIGGAALEYRFTYRRWPKAGDLLTLRSGLKHVGPKTYTWAHWMFDLETGKAVATAEAVAIALDLEARKAIPIPDDMRAHLESHLIEGIGA